MLFVFVFVASIIITAAMGTFKDPLENIPLLPYTYKDIFVGNKGGKPQLGTTSATCWARGGICVHIKECPEGKSFDSGVSGCTKRFKVCCKLFKQLSPTVGVQRSRDVTEEDVQESSDFVEGLLKSLIY